MFLFLIVVLIICLIAGGFGLAVHALIWLFWVALVIFIIGLVFGVVTKAFTRGKKTTS